MDIRQITRDEVPEFIRLLQYSFGKYSDAQIEQERIDAHPLDGSFAAFDGDRLVSQIVVHSFEQSLRGHSVGMGGVAGVGTVPEYRGRGLIRRLLTHSFGWMRDNGLPVSMLRPFKEAYYERFGFVRTSHAIRVEIPNATFVDYAVRTPPGISFVRLPVDEAQEFYFRSLNEFKSALHGRVVYDQLGEFGWKRRFKDRLFVFAMDGERPVAMFTYTKEGFLDDGRMVLQDLFWTGRAGRDSLFAFFAMHQDQIGTIKLTLPYDINFTALFPRLAVPVTFEYVAAPWMVRIIDVEDALSGFPVDGQYEAGESVVLKVEDPLCEWNADTFLLTARDGSLSVERTTRAPNIVCSVTALSAMIYGSFGVEQIFEEFPSETAPASAQALLARWFPPRALFNDYWF